MRIIAKQKETFEFEVMPPLLLPYYNIWGANAYWHYKPFNHNPFTLSASSTSGSPVVIAGGKFFGFLNERGGEYAFDGINKLTITLYEGEELYYCEDCNPYTQWEKYNEIIVGDEIKQNEDFWSELEYCTWVEQKKIAILSSVNADAPLCEKMVYSYIKRVEKLGLPKGKLTIDDGWAVATGEDGRPTYGNWEIDRNKFPHMEQLVKDISSAGFIPGLWFAPCNTTPNSKLALAHPNLVGTPFGGSAEAESERRLMYIIPDECLKDYYHSIFQNYIAMGFRKFKLDMSYGNKAEMNELLKMIYTEIKSIDKTVEVEIHIPDIFVSRFCDTVRINDVAFDTDEKWRSVAMNHYNICKYSSHNRILNLDHIGTNTPLPKAQDFMDHWKMLSSLKGGYPVISLLPDFFSDDICKEFVRQINMYVNKQF